MLDLYYDVVSLAAPEPHFPTKPRPDIHDYGCYYGAHRPDQGNILLDSGSQTFDNARGSRKVRWLDNFGCQTQVNLDKGRQMGKYAIPITMGGTWNWVDGDGGLERTGFNGHVTWIEVTFFRQPGSTFRDPYVRMSSVGFIPRELGRADTIMDDIKKQTANAAEIAENCEKVVQSGVRSAKEVIKLAKCAKGLPVCG